MKSSRQSPRTQGKADAATIQLALKLKASEKKCIELTEQAEMYKTQTAMAAEEIARLQAEEMGWQ